MPPWPEWRPQNLSRHHKKRVRKDDECVKIDPPDYPDPPIAEDEYKKLSKEVVREAWREATFYHCEEGEYRRFFVDEELVLSVTSDRKKYFITCYHVHTDKSLFRSDCEMTMDKTKDDRKEEFNRWVEDLEKEERWQNVEDQECD